MHQIVAGLVEIAAIGAAERRVRGVDSVPDLAPDGFLP